MNQQEYIDLIQFIEENKLKSDTSDREVICVNELVRFLRSMTYIDPIMEEEE